VFDIAVLELLLLLADVVLRPVQHLYSVFRVSIPGNGRIQQLSLTSNCDLYKMKIFVYFKLILLRLFGL
jgi:hypothetical protein